MTGFLTARDLHDPILNGAAQARAEWEIEKAELDERIRVVDEQLQEIYAEWNGEEDD